MFYIWLFFIQLVLSQECQYIRLITSDISGTCINGECIPNSALLTTIQYTSTYCQNNNTCDLYYLIDNIGQCVNSKCRNEFGEGDDDICDPEIYTTNSANSKNRFFKY